MSTAAGTRSVATAGGRRTRRRWVRRLTLVVGVCALILILLFFVGGGYFSRLIYSDGLQVKQTPPNAEHEVAAVGDGSITLVDRPGQDSILDGDNVWGVLEEAFAVVPGDELLARLDAAGVPSGRVQTLQEVYEWDQTRSQGLMLNVDHPTLGLFRPPGPPLRFFTSNGAETTPTQHTGPPLLDEHGPAVRAWLQAG